MPMRLMLTQECPRAGHRHFTGESPYDLGPEAEPVTSTETEYNFCLKRLTLNSMLGLTFASSDQLAHHPL